MMMDLETLDWDEEILGILGVPRAMLPAIKASSEVYGEAKANLSGIPVAGDLGDQQAALFGQTCFSVGEAKNTYGTGNFLLLNTGNEIVPSKSGLITGLGYKIGDQQAVYMLEGSIAITGALVQWLRDNVGLISSAPEVETLAKTVDDNGGVYSGAEDMRANGGKDKEWQPQMDPQEREKEYAFWKKAVTRTFDWLD